MGADHRLVRMRHRGREIDVDEEMAPLIQELWRAGIETVACCQEGEDGLAWIEFRQAGDAERFLNAVAVYEDGNASLYRRLSWLAFTPDEEGGARLHPKSWRYWVRPVDETLQTEGPASNRPAFVLSLSVLFPREDLPILLGRMRGRNG